MRQARRIAVSKLPCNFCHRDSISDSFISSYKGECWITADYLHSNRLEVTSMWSIYYPNKQWEQSYRSMLAPCSAFADKRHTIRQISEWFCCLTCTLHKYHMERESQSSPCQFHWQWPDSPKCYSSYFLEWNKFTKHVNREVRKKMKEDGIARLISFLD